MLHTVGGHALPNKWFRSIMASNLHDLKHQSLMSGRIWAKRIIYRDESKTVVDSIQVCYQIKADYMNARFEVINRHGRLVSSDHTVKLQMKSNGLGKSKYCSIY